MAAQASAPISCSSHPCSMHQATDRPTMACASRKGTPSRTSASARSVAVEKPLAAAARMRSRFTVMPGSISANTRRQPSSWSQASNTACLSSCMSLL